MDNLKKQYLNLICGGIGGGAQTALAAAGIKLFGGVSGDADEAVEAFINETFDYNPDVKCSHKERKQYENKPHNRLFS